MKKISLCLWFNNQAEEAVKLYSSLFGDVKVGLTSCYGESAAKVSNQDEGSVLQIELEIEGQKLLALNGGPQFKFTPAMSIFVWCEYENEIERLWKGLSEGGQVRMELGKYPWSPKYGWTADRFGVEWQLMLSDSEKMAPALLFVDNLCGKGDEAIEFYLSVFKNSKIEFVARDESTNTIMHCLFSMNGNHFVLMEGKGDFKHQFTPASSLVINCDSQDDIDYYWSRLSSDPNSEQCGWLKDKYGVSWQVVPSVLSSMVSDSDKSKSEKVMKALLQMKKIDLKKLEDAYLA